jgi:hypothetical protein
MSIGSGKVTVRVAGNQNLSKYLKTLDVEAREIFYQGIDEIGKIGADEARRIIQTTGSKSSRSGLKAKLGFGAAGRIRTGNMYKSIGFRPRRGEKLYQAEVGYIRNYKDYYKYQERGFKNIWKFVRQWNRPYSNAPNAPAGWKFERLSYSEAPTVKGIFALRGARQKMSDSIPRIMQKVDKRISTRMGKK